MPNDWQSDPQGYLSGLVGSPVQITSGLRDPQHNAVVGGVPNSAHLSGQAFDFVPQGGDMKSAAAKLAQSGVPFDQVINEGNHIHVSFAPTNRRQVLGQGQVSQPGISDDDLLKALTGGTPSSNAVTTGTGHLSDDAILKALTGDPSKTPPPPAGAASSSTPSAMSSVADAVRSIPGGLVKGVASVAGIPGDLEDLGNKGLGGLLKLAGANPDTVDKTNALMASRPLAPPTSAAIGNAVSKPFGGFYQPQTTAGKYADTISQFAPAALAPGNALVRAARVAIPGAASEAAGQATEGTPYEGAARLGGALVGAAGLGGAHQLIENGKEAIPSTSDIKTAASAAYKKAEQAGVVIKDSAVQGLAGKITQDVTDAGIDPTLHPKAMAAVKRITDSTGDLTLKRMDILRRVANGAAGSMDKDESRIAHIVLDHIDDFVQNLSPNDVLSGNTQQASDAITEARSLWAKSAKSGTIDSLMNRAKNRAETVGGSGLENAMRVEFRQLAQNPKRLSRFNPDEQEAIINVARGGPIGNAARTLGKLAPTSMIPILSELGAYAVDPKAIAVPLVGAAARLAATAATKRNASLASEMIRRGGPATAKQVMAPSVLSSLLGRNKLEEQQQPNALVPSFQQ